MPKYRIRGTIELDKNEKEKTPRELCGFISILFVIIVSIFVLFPNLRVHLIDTINGNRNENTETCSRISYLQGKCVPD